MNLLKERFEMRTFTRRDFFVTSVMAGVSVASLDAVGANDRIQAAVIGCGRRGSALLASLAQRRDVHVVAACDIARARREAAAAAWGSVKVEHAWQDIVARDDVDAIVIAAPDHWHAPMAIAAMKAGKDVYCEPPMALTAADAQAVRDCADTCASVVQIGARQPFEGQWRTAGRLIHEGRLGTMRRCQATYMTRSRSDTTSSATTGLAPNASPYASLQRESLRPDDVDWHAFLGPAPERPFDAGRYHNWRAYWDYSGGVITDVHFGALAALLAATGLDYPSRVSAAGGVYVRGAREVPDSFMMTAAYPGDATIVLASSPVARCATPAVIRGDRASLFCEGDAVRLAPLDESDAGGVRIGVEPCQDAVTDWLDCIRVRRAPVCNPQLAHKAAVAMGMAVAAYRTQKTMDRLAREETNMKCVICKHGETQPGEATITLERGGVTLVFKSVPALVCDNCGEEYVDEDTTSRLLDAFEDAARSGVLVDVREFAGV